MLLHWIHGDNVKGNYNAKFLETIDLALKKCHFSFVPKAEQLQAIHAVVTGNDGFVKPEQDLSSVFATCTSTGKGYVYTNVGRVARIF